MPVYGYPLPKNRNLDRGPWFGDASSSLRRKALFIGDATGELNDTGVIGHIAREHAGPITGLFVHASRDDEAQGAYSLLHDGAGGRPSITGATVTEREAQKSDGDLDAVWALDSNTSDHLAHSVDIELGSNLADGVELHRFGLINAANFNDIDIDAGWMARPIHRAEVGTIPGFTWHSFSAATNAATGDATLTLDGDVTYTPLYLPSTALVGSPGDEPRGVAIETGSTSGSEAGTDLNLLGCVFARSDNGTAMVDNGLMIASSAQGAYSAYDHRTRISQNARNALYSAFGGFDEIWIVLGHGAEDDSADRVEAIEALGKRIASEHNQLGLDPPKIGLIIPWASGATTLTEDMVYRLDKAAVERRWGLINLWAIYNGVDPGTNGADYNGNARTYTMSGGGKSIGDSATAGFIADDILAAFADKADSYNPEYVWENTQ